MRWLLPTLGLVAILTGCGGTTETQESPAQAPATAQVAAPAATTLSPTPVLPERLRMDDIDARVLPLELSGDTLVPPDDPTTLGWWGRKAGARHGTTLLVGHTVHTGGGDLDDLEDIALGETAVVGGVEYEVTSNEVISKAALARRAERLFGQSGKHRLVVVTCEDYDSLTGHYDSNVVLTAVPTN